ncbi:hypothetical protein Zmor_006046 [Zophobas morio]|uniref:Uncharacterized protein n=1 Tax=Zophobas morio TaxID=2755281 RepID=A0AA38MN07_9CUCU|nr:hypothetical protein Zmor_006046 [Zophobas morio]
MKRAERESFAQRVCHYYEHIANKDKFRTVCHFADENQNRRSLYNILSRYERTGNSNYKKISGRPVSKRTQKLCSAIEKMFKNDPNTPERAVAAKLDICQSYLHELKVKRLGINAHKCKTVPYYTHDQKVRAKTACRKIVDKRAPKQSGKIIVMDDETSWLLILLTFQEQSILPL